MGTYGYNFQVASLWKIGQLENNIIKQYKITFIWIKFHKTKGPQMNFEDKVYKTKEPVNCSNLKFCRLITNF